MLATDRAPEETFAPASAGARVRIVTMLAVLVLVAASALNAWFVPRQPVHSYGLAVAAPLTGVMIVALVGWLSRVSELRLSGTELIIVRPGRSLRFALDGLVSVQPDPEALRGALRVVGNDGLGAISGRFRSKKLGRFRAYVSDSAHAVVIKSAAGVMVVSPAQHRFFSDSVRRRLATCEGRE